MVFLVEAFLLKGSGVVVVAGTDFIAGHHPRSLCL